MKKLVLFCLILFAGLSFAQTTTENYVGGTGGTIVYFYLSSMNTSSASDSLDIYYSSPINMPAYWNDNWSTNDFTYVIYANSANDTHYAAVNLQGRMSSGGESAWIDVDTLYTSGTEGTFKGLFDMDDLKFEQIRIKVDGLANNRADAMFKVWLALNKRGSRAFPY